MLALGGEVGVPRCSSCSTSSRAASTSSARAGARHDEDYPLLYADQDVLNAILAARVGEDRVVALDPRLAPMPPFAGLRVVDERALRCAYDDGTEPYVVHHFIVKPWLEPTHHGVYSQLLRRLLIGDDVAIRVPDDESRCGCGAARSPTPSASASTRRERIRCTSRADR